jgi:hypothetical protein
MDSLLLTDTVSHVLTAVKHAQQPMEPLPTNVKAATQASVSMAMECANHATHLARPVPAAGKPIPVHHAMKTPPWEHLDIVSVTSLRFVSSPAGLVKTTVQAVLFSTHPKEPVLMVIGTESHSKSITNSKTDSQHSTMEQTLKAMKL